MSAFIDFRSATDRHLPNVGDFSADDLHNILGHYGPLPSERPVGSDNSRIVQSHSDSTVVPSWLQDIVDRNNQATAEAARIDREFQLSTMREANVFTADQAELAFQRGQASAREAMDFEHNEAELERRFINQQRSSAYQVAVDDLRAAGLNPALAYANGGASVTSGASASGFSSAGSSARGVSASGSRATVDTSTVANFLTAATYSAAQLSRHDFGGLIDAAAQLGSFIGKSYSLRKAFSSLPISGLPAVQ